MTITKETIVDKIEIVEDNVLQVRSATKLIEDGKVLSELFERRTLRPGADLSSEDPKVVAVANVLWT